MLTTGDIKLVYPSNWPAINNTGSTVGGSPSTGSFVISSTTGLFPTGSSSVAGGASYNRYAKVFFLHTGATGSTNNLQDPFIYIANESINNQITIAPDPYFLNTDSAQTGNSTGRAAMPNGLTASHFTGYTAESPMYISSLPRGSFTLTSGGSVGLWVKQTIPAGLISSANNNFQLVIKGDIV